MLSALLALELRKEGLEVRFRLRRSRAHFFRAPTAALSALSEDFGLQAVLLSALSAIAVLLKTQGVALQLALSAMSALFPRVEQN